MRLIRPGIIAGLLYPEAIFRIKTDEKMLFLTFDDGPDSQSTPQLLEILDSQNVKGVFFCDGQAAEKYSGLVQLIISRGHIVGNHGYMHFDGWKTTAEKYLEDVSRAAGLTSSVLFRPPFGRMKIGQYRILKEKYRIILWDIMCYDFDKNFGIEKSLQVFKKMMRPGSIIVLHDKPSSSANIMIPELINYALNNGYRFVLPDY